MLVRSPEKPDWCAGIDFLAFIGWKHRNAINMIKGSLGGETSVLRTFRMSEKELVKKP